MGNFAEKKQIVLDQYRYAIGTFEEDLVLLSQRAEDLLKNEEKLSAQVRDLEELRKSPADKRTVLIRDTAGKLLGASQKTDSDLAKELENLRLNLEHNTSQRYGNVTECLKCTGEMIRLYRLAVRVFIANDLSSLKAVVEDQHFKSSVDGRSVLDFLNDL